MNNLSIVIPAFNEAGRLPETLWKIISCMNKGGFNFEILICDDGGTDGTRELIAGLFPGHDEIKYLRENENRGKGHAVRRGVLSARFDFILVTDADLSTPFEEIEKLWPEALNGRVAMGSRALKGSVLLERQPFYREGMGKLFNKIIRLILDIPFHDTQCGFKLYPAEAARKLFKEQTIQGYSFEVEMVLKARRLGIECREIPVEWHDSIPSRVHIVRDSLRMLRDVIRLGLKPGRPR